MNMSASYRRLLAVGGYLAFYLLAIVYGTKGMRWQAFAATHRYKGHATTGFISQIAASPRIAATGQSRSPLLALSATKNHEGFDNTFLPLLFPEHRFSEENDTSHANELTEGQPLFEEKPQIHSKSLKMLEKHGLSRMTPIQAQAFDILYEGKDAIARSHTGTGKTLAFLLPILEKMRASVDEQSDDRPHKRLPKLLVLEPTRELSTQVEEQARFIASLHDLSSVCCYGGTSYIAQEEALRRGVDIIIGTPGRLIDFLEKNMIDLSLLRHVVLDEADEMLNMGFAPEVEKILSYTNTEDAQVLLFSATTPRWVHELSKQYLKNPQVLDVVGKSIERTPPSVQHIAIQTPWSTHGKAAIIEDIVAVEGNGGQTIVFTQTKREADELSSEGAFKAFNAAVLHGDIGQATREHTMKRFKRGLFKVLVATDVAARGIDVGNVDLVVQCRPPSDPDVYVHRSGRTGRAGRQGACVLLFSEEERTEIAKLEHACGIKFNVKPPPSTVTILNAAASAASKQLDSVSSPVIQFFQNAAKDVLQRAASAGILEDELIARCLAVIAKKPEIQARSMLNGMPEFLTLHFHNLKREWRDAGDAFYWIHRVAGKVRFVLPKSIGSIRFAVNDRSDAFFDLPVGIARQFLSRINATETSEELFMSLEETTHLPELQEQEKHFFSRDRNFVPRKYNKLNGSARFFKNRDSYAEWPRKSRNYDRPVGIRGNGDRYLQNKERFSSPRNPVKHSYWDD